VHPAFRTPFVASKEGEHLRRARALNNRADGAHPFETPPALAFAAA
jgi:hypothetical protein